MPLGQNARKRDIWLIDLGMAGKFRPGILLTEYPNDNELALITIVPHTTALRGTRWELRIPKRFLSNDGAFHFQQIQSISIAKLIRKLGALTDAEWSAVEHILADRFEL
jgi:mRNA interferase MazF